MNRLKVIQNIINKIGAQTYLEIGAKSGGTFLPIKARHKIAVDPVFDLSIRRKIKWILRNPYNITAKYYELPSDEYFEALQHTFVPTLACIFSVVVTKWIRGFIVVDAHLYGLIFSTVCVICAYILITTLGHRWLDPSPRDLALSLRKLLRLSSVKVMKQQYESND